MLHEILESIWKRLSRELVVKAAFLLPPERRRALERRIRGREEARKLALADVVVVSFGKSGRTWVRTLLSRFFQLRYGLKESAFIGFDNLHRRDARIPRVFFTHDNYIGDYTGHREDKRDFYGKRTALLVRHPADVAVSQYFQWKFRMRPGKKALNRYPSQGADISIYDFVMDDDAGLPKIIRFMNDWARAREQVADRLILMRYEDLRANTAGELERMLRFMGHDPRPADLADCVAFASVENMRALEEKRVFWLAGSRMKAKDTSNPDSYKVRRAKVGGYRDYFDEAQAAAIQRLIDERLMPGFGYLSREREAPPAAVAAVR
jgi:Sulfotransferase domain